MVAWLDRIALSRLRRPGNLSGDGPRAPDLWLPGLAAERPARREKRDFEALVLPHAAALYRTAYHLCGNAVEAEDLTQETYLRAYRAFASMRGNDPRPWLFAILRHAFIDECRRQGRRPEITHDPGEITMSTASAVMPSAESEALRRLPSEAIERAFAALPSDWRLIVLLADVEDFSYREIADVMDVPLGTVMSRLHRARKRLQHHLLEVAQPNWKSDEKSA